MSEKMKRLLAEYGKVAIGVYLAIFVVVFSGFAVAIRFGFSVEGAAGGAGTLAAAYVATKVAQPLRILATVVLTPVLAAVIGRFRREEVPPESSATSTTTE